MSNSNNQKSSFSPFLLGFILGGAIGTFLGFLLSPKSGAEMRYDLSEGVGDVQNKTKKILDETKYNLEDRFSQSKQVLKTTVERITEAFNAGRKSAEDSIKVHDQINEDEDEKDEG
ncbi:MAG: YtxH domain-containing protein [Candidatus Sericytochromatia bacterium]